MTTPDGPVPEQDRARRPGLERTEPRRNILNAFRQEDARGAPRPGPHYEDDAHWRATAAPSPAPGRPGGAAWDSVAEAVQAGYGVIDAHIREGLAEAGRRGGAAASGPEIGPAGRGEVAALLARLSRSVTDIGAIWLDLLSAALERERPPVSAPPAAPELSPLPGSGAGLLSAAVELSSALPATARLRLHRPVRGALTALPLRGAGGGEIAGVIIRPGLVVAIAVPEGAAPGDYHGILLEEGAEDPAGTVTLRILPP